MPDTPFAQRLRIAIAAAGTNGTSLAASLGLGDNTVTGWIRGRRKPKPSSLQLLAGALGVSVAWLTEPAFVVLEGQGRRAA